jgi:hypothetical protein
MSAFSFVNYNPNHCEMATRELFKESDIYKLAKQKGLY